MSDTSKGPVRRIRLRAVVAYPVVSIALVVTVAFALTPFGAEPGMAFTGSATTTESSATETSAPLVDPTPPAPTTAAPTTAPPTTSIPTATDPTTSGPPTATGSAPGPVPSPVPGPLPSLTQAPGDASVDHVVLAWVNGSDLPPTYLLIDAPALEASQLQTFRVRFQLSNAGADPVTAIPRLEYRADGGAGFTVVPENAQPGIAFHLAREWVPSLGLAGGTDQGPLAEAIAVSDLKLPSAVGVPTIGHHSMGPNPDAAITLPPASYTDQEFTVRLSMDAKYLTGYELRITDAGVEMAGTRVARIVLGSPPPLQLSAGQRQGVVVGAPATTGATRFPLASGSLSPATEPSSITVPVVSTGTGSPHDMAAAQCGVCHRGHTAQAASLLTQNRQSTLCFSCHDGTGTAKDVKGAYTALALPANDPVQREYYSHDVLAPSTTPAASKVDQFGGVSNRRSECGDCHNSHRARATDSTQTADGWDASGRLAGVSGVSVVNGAAGSAPAYTFLDGVMSPVTREYQLCFKCHSGSTTLTSNAGLKPSQYALDKGVELNPANPSFHPVEAAGKNQTAKMADSLAGTSPYKLWNFNIGSTIRCLNCHASGTTPAAAAPPTEGAGTALAPHTSSNRGILLRNYQDRVLKSTNAAYSAGDFALCFVCHGEEPFANNTSNATNFRLHGLHAKELADEGSGGTSIDTPGDGQGNAICAECHFRIHSTTAKVGPQEIPGSRLLNFAPNVQPLAGTLSWTPGATSGGSCTLTCHGYEHKALGY